MKNTKTKNLVSALVLASGIFFSSALFAQIGPPPIAVTGISNETPDSKAIKIWSSGNLVHINLPESVTPNAAIHIYNLLGQVLVSEKVDGVTAYTKDLSGLVSGYIIVTVTDDKTAVCKRLFINKTE